MDLPLVSVIIPVFNGANFIEDSINSVLRQTYSNIEIIVVNDGSTDGTETILNNYSSKIQKINKTNGGAASARNLGILLSNGSLLAFLDADDVWLPNKLQKQYELLISTGSDFVYCGVQDFKDSKLMARHIPFSFDTTKYFLQNPISMPIYAAPSSILIKKSELSKIGLFDTLIPLPSDDWDFVRRCCSKLKFNFSDSILVQYRIHDSNISKQSLDKIYPGFRYAVSKMIFESNCSIKFKRFVWIKMHFLLSISAFKNKMFKYFVFLIFSGLGSISPKSK